MALAREGILEPYELRYSDLIRLTSQAPPSSSSPDSARVITSSVMRALGPGGPGLLSITGVPNASVCRRRLLPLARRLALLEDSKRKSILKEHGLGSDVPLKKLDRAVSSFSIKLKYEEVSPVRCEIDQDPPSRNYDNDDMIPIRFQGDEFKDIGTRLKELSSIMMDLGIRVARICDKEIGGEELERSLLESSSAKGRLIHYHSPLDNDILSLNLKKNGSIKTSTSLKTGVEDASGGARKKASDLWQQWHYDYGVFTVLTAPMFMIPEKQNGSVMKECTSPCGHTHLQILSPEKDEVLAVSAPQGSFIVQVGEAADILSNGKLRSTLHSVGLPSKDDRLCRETFVVFLQPSWSKRLYISGCNLDRHGDKGEPYEGGEVKEEGERVKGDMNLLVPSMLSRLKDGMTFAEFARETTKQYYGWRGLQSNKD